MKRYKIRRKIGERYIERRGIRLCMDELECGHLVRHRYITSTAERIKALIGINRRCFICGTNEED